MNVVDAGRVPVIVLGQGPTALGILREGRERLLGIGDDRLVALGLAELDQLDIVGELLLDLPDGADIVVELLALAHHLLRAVGIVPELRVFGGGVQLLEADRGTVPVKDASSAG